MRREKRRDHPLLSHGQLLVQLLVPERTNLKKKQLTPTSTDFNL
jgi:hypothetical protein